MHSGILVYLGKWVGFGRLIRSCWVVFMCLALCVMGNFYFCSLVMFKLLNILGGRCIVRRRFDE